MSDVAGIAAIVLFLLVECLEVHRPIFFWWRTRRGRAP